MTYGHSDTSARVKKLRIQAKVGGMTRATKSRKVSKDDETGTGSVKPSGASRPAEKAWSGRGGEYMAHFQISPYAALSVFPMKHFEKFPG